MIYLQLFLNFLMIGALSFGGGYGMISLVRETVLRHGWLTEAEFLSFVAVSESTPAPLAINMAPFICGCGSLSFRRAALCGGHDPGDRAEYDALHTGRHQDDGGWICTGCEIDPCVCCFMGGAFCLEEADAKSPVAHRNDPAGGGTGNPVLGRMRDHRPFFVAQCSTNSPRRANMWSMGPEPLPRSSMADRQPEIYALARSTAASRG